MGYSALAIIASTCIGYIAVMLSLTHSNGFAKIVMLFLTVIVCSAHDAAILTVQN